MTDEQWSQFWEDMGVDDDSVRQKIITALPAMSNQDPDSNNQQILGVIADIIIDEVANLRRIYEWRDLDRNQGGGLDDVAADWGVHRIDDDDDFLRFEIRLAKMLNRTGVAENDIIDLIAFVLQADPTEFNLITDPNQLGGDPEAIRLTNIPNRYSKSQRKKDLLVKSLEKAIMPEVKIIGVDFQASADMPFFIGSVVQRNRSHIICEEV